MSWFGKDSKHIFDNAVDEIAFTLRCSECPAYHPDDCSGFISATECKERIKEKLANDDDCRLMKLMKDQDLIDRLPTPTQNYPQDTEANEYRYMSPTWLDAIAEGLTAGAVKHPGETWRQIPADEHLARAMRHINLYRMGDRSEPHLVNASMRLMMAFETAKKEETT